MIAEEGEDLLIFHEGLLAEAAGNVKDIEGRAVGQGLLGGEEQATGIAEGAFLFDEGVDLCEMRENLERACEIGLVDVGKKEGTDGDFSRGVHGEPD